MNQAETPKTPTISKKAFSFSGAIRALYDWMLQFAVTPYAVIALALFAFAESSFFPIPPDVLLLAMGVAEQKKVFYYAAICTGASTLGGLLGYAMGALLWGQLQPLFLSYVPGFTLHSFDNVQQLYLTYGVGVVLLAGFTPIPYKLFTVTSGVMGLPLIPFILASIVGRGARFFLVATLLHYYGEPIQQLIERHFNRLAMLFGIVFVGGFLLVKWLL